MTKNQALKLAKNGVSSGKEHMEIAADLKEAGYQGRRGFLTSSGVGLMLRRKGIYTRNLPKKKASPNPQHRFSSHSSVNAVKSILRLSLPPEERIALLQLILKV